MLLIPAIRLMQGRALGADGAPAREKPEEFAARLADAGVTRLQFVDEDSLTSERASILPIVERIASRFDHVGVQVVTGVRDEEQVQSHLDAGANWIVMGHRAASAPHLLKDLCLEYPGHILIGLNVRDGRMAGDAHSKLSNHELLDLAEHFQSDGVNGIVYQQVDADDRPLAPDEGVVRELSSAVGVDVLVSGRIESLDALEGIVALGEAGVAGVVVNGALHDIDFAAACRLAESVD